MVEGAPRSIPYLEALQKGYFPCLDFNLLCRVYGCRPDQLEILEGESQNLIYYKGWNIAYENRGRGGHCIAYYGNPFYDFFSSNVTQVQWTNKEPAWRWSQVESRKGMSFTPEETALLLNAFTEIMHWREDPTRAAELKKFAKHAFDVPGDSEEFQKFLREREQKLVLNGLW